ncbi:hypothetical protein JG687_00007856 [Phytophthora cactorum]|uniref:Dynactin subunit 6 n=1 Tax=Phytophthora cactorum TaxID=29920 RepID=A0A8T1UH39_9STRA|nr:hypothetical protein JG687_00007856 [Phytophthora cactorum]
MTQQVEVARTAAVCMEAQLQGAITVGERCAVHPGASVRSTGGPIVLGERCFVEDGALLINDMPEDMKIGSDNLFESGCEVRSRSVGSGNWFEPKARTLEGSVIGSNCLIGSGVVVAAGEFVPDNSILVAVQTPQGDTRRVVREQKDYLIKTHAALIQNHLGFEKANMLGRLCAAAAIFAVVVNGEDVDGASEAEENKTKTEPVAQVDRTLEELRFPVLFDAIVNRSVVLEHIPETHDLRVRSIEKEEIIEVEVEVEVDASTVKSCNSTAMPCSLEANDTGINENALPPPSLQPTDRLILSPNMLEFEPATPQRTAVVTAWVEEKARLKAEREARELEIANNKALQEKLAEERRVAEALARKEQELLEKLDKEEYERTRMTPHNLAAGKRRDGWEFRYEVEFTTKGPIGLNWDLNTRDKAVVSHLEPKLPAQQFNVIAPRDQLISLNGVDTSKMGPEQVVEVYLGSALPRKMVFLVQMSAERAAAKAADKNPVKRVVMNWTLAFDAPEILRGWEVRLHLASWSTPPEINETNASLPLLLEFATPITGCTQFPEAPQSSNNDTSGVVYLAYRGACTLIEKSNHAQAANGKALLIVNNVNGEGRFTPTAAVVVEHVELPVTLMGKLDGELIMSVVEHQETLIRIYEERPDQVPVSLEQPSKLTNQELTIGRDVKKSGRNMTFWYINASTAANTNEENGNLSSFAESYEFQPIRKRLRAITKGSGSSPLVRLSLSSAVDVHLGQSSERFKMLVVLGCFLSIATSL